MTQDVSVCVVPELVAAGVEEPAVVSNRQGEREHGEPLHGDEHSEHIRGTDGQHEISRAPELLPCGDERGGS